MTTENELEHKKDMHSQGFHNLYPNVHLVVRVNVSSLLSVKKRNLVQRMEKKKSFFFCM